MKLSIFICGGGMKSVAYAGFLQALIESDRYEIVSLVGTSGGSVIASLFALELPMQRAVTYFKNFNPYPAILDKNYSSWTKYSYSIFGNTVIEETKIPLSIQAYNKKLNTITYFRNGNIFEAVVASSALVKPFYWNDQPYLDSNEMQIYEPVYQPKIEKVKTIILKVRMENDIYIERLLIKILIPKKQHKSLENEYEIVEINIPTQSIVSNTNLDYLFECGRKSGISFDKKAFVL